MNFERAIYEAADKYARQYWWRHLPRKLLRELWHGVTRRLRRG